MAKGLHHRSQLVPVIDMRPFVPASKSYLLYLHVNNGKCVPFGCLCCNLSITLGDIILLMVSMVVMLALLIPCYEAFHP